jgi:hypothetical protein
MNLGHLARCLLLAALGTTASFAAEGRPPYVETSSFSILSNFYTTVVTQSLRPLPANITRFLPEGVNVKPGERLNSEVGKPAIFPTGNGDQALFVRLVQKKVLENLAIEYQINANRLELINLLTEKRLSDELDDYTDEVARILSDATFAAAFARAELEAINPRRYLRYFLASTELADAERYVDLADYGERIKNFTDQELILERVIVSQRAAFAYANIVYLSDRLGNLWELTTVRAPQTSLADSSSNAYTLVLTSIDSTAGRPAITYDSGLRVELLGAAPSATETLVDGKLSSVRGNIRHYFKLSYEFLDANTSLYELEVDSIPNAVFREDYATAGAYWRGEITGTLSYDLRATTSPANFRAVAQNRSSTARPLTFTGTGFWYYQTYEDQEIFTFNSGVSPTRVLLGPVKYQDEALFEDIPLN